jgi:hypothetical protein
MAFNVKTIEEAIMAMRTRAIVCIERYGTGRINQIAVEDGSGRNWIVTIQPEHGPAVNVFFRS